MNILYIAPFRQTDGWGLGAKDYLLSLLTIKDISVKACSYITNYSSLTDNIPSIIKKAEENKLDKIDVIIQNSLVEGSVFGLPGETKKHILLTYLENRNLVIPESQILSLFSEVWVANDFNKSIIETYNRNVCSIGHPINTEEISNILKNNPKISQKKSFKFYTIGEHIQRKNLMDIVIAFNLEFDPIVDNVELIIKTSVPGKNYSEARNQFLSDIDSIKEQMRYKKYSKSEQVITEKLDFTTMVALHNTCDCFVVSSFGEALCRGAAEALCVGNPVIAHESIGIVDYIKQKDLYLYDTVPSPVVVDDLDMFRGLNMYNAEESWSIPNIYSLRKQMRLAYEEKKKLDHNHYLNKFSYETIGKNICQRLL